MEVESVHPRDFVAALERQELKDSLILDVRQQHEWNYYHLDEAVLVPMNEVPGRLGELPDDKPIYVVCAHGVRSYMVCELMKERGFERVINVDGGMAAIGMLRGFAYD